MLNLLKRIFYFPLAWYFRFWAQIKLSKWQPRIIVITGSSGKTTLLHLIESQLGDKAKYSHHANSSFGIPFDILGLHRDTLTLWEWPSLFLLAPVKAFTQPPLTNLYIVEADCDRPGEGKFLSEFLRPEVTLWVSLSKTHSINFPTPVEASIAHEFGYFVQNTNKLVIANGDSDPIQKQLPRSRTQNVLINKKDWLNKYKVSKSGTQFTLKEKTYSFKYLLPEETVYSIAICIEIMNYLSHPLDPKFTHFSLPPGRSSIFAGVKHTTLIDSTYNSNLESASAILNMYRQLDTHPKWAILGDLLEQGTEEKAEHEKLADVIVKASIDKVVLMGPRVKKYTYPKLPKETIVFVNPPEVLQYLEAHNQGGETILFKGARFLEGVIAHLLADKADIAQLPRREKIWEMRRKKWGL